MPRSLLDQSPSRGARLFGFFLTFGAGHELGHNDKAMSNELSAQDLLPPEIGLTLLGFEKSEQGWLVRAEGRTRSECPSCRTQSTARHSRYWRQLQDLPVQGKRVALQLRLSRWRCRRSSARRTTGATSCRPLHLLGCGAWMNFILRPLPVSSGEA